MAVCYISEFKGYAQVGTQMGNDGGLPSLNDQTVAIGAALSSNPFSVNTHLILVSVDAACSIKAEPNGSTTVNVTNLRMAANTSRYFAVIPGQVLSVISNT